jgi:hypothetical protein
VRTLILLVLAGAFTVVSAMMDIAFVSTLITQARATGFAEAQGVITRSEYQAWPDRPDTFDADIAYAYEVNGRTYEGVGLRGATTMGAMDRNGAQALTRAWPQGARVSVHYDPRHPDFSLLQRGIQGADLLMLLIAVLFNMAAGVLLLFLIAETVGLPRFAVPEAGMRTFARGRRVHARLEHFRPVFTLVATLAFTAFVSLWIASTQVSSTGEIAMGPMLAIWAGVIGLTALATFTQYRKQESGLADLIIDAEQGVVEIPRLESPSKRLTVTLADITDVGVDTVVRRGMRGSRTHTDQVLLRHRDGRSLLVAELGDTDRAHVFSNWLRRQIDDARQATAAT